MESQLDWNICSRARLSRDARFDGKFFIGVRGSGVYCRPICPAPTAAEKNCRYFSTAAAAAEAGYRPCLRCRPEASPGTPAWLGTSATVSRALRLIEERGLDDGLEGLTKDLGVSARHLSRLFVKHLGATPSAIAKTRRVHFAKKLIDETALPMNQLALAAGYGCVRRFNADISKTYHRTPGRLRMNARAEPVSSGDEYPIRLPYRPPLDWEAMLAHLAAQSIPGVERVDGVSYRRTFALNGKHGWFDVQPEKTRAALRAKIKFGDPQALFSIVQRIRGIFDLNADWQAISVRLGKDTLFQKQLKRQPGLRIPGCWSGYELAVAAILNRTGTRAQFYERAERLAAGYGQPIASTIGLTHVFPDAGVLAKADLEDDGFSAKQANAIRALSAAHADGKINFDSLPAEQLASLLKKLTGMDRWMADGIAMRAAREPDMLVVHPCLLRPEMPTLDAVKTRAEHWRPWRSYASLYLLAASGCGLHFHQQQQRKRVKAA